MTVLKVGSIEELPADEILIAYIREAVDLNGRGVKVLRPRKRRSPRMLAVSDDLQAALQRNPAALATFEGFSFSHRKEYIVWITDAQREATRQQRLTTAIEWLAAGKPRNWKYMRGYRSHRSAGQSRILCCASPSKKEVRVCSSQLK